jgi:formate hydrogenlyase transcriptional activator
MFSRRMSKEVERVPDETMSALCAYDWPGNIRELQNLVERAVILANDGVIPNPLPPRGAQPAIIPVVVPPTTLKDSERALILETLEQVGWVIGGSRGAAAKLGVKRTTLIHKMKKLGISRATHQNKTNGSVAADQANMEDPELERSSHVAFGH